VRAALFVTCLVDGVVPQVAKATVRVLERVGVTVEMPWEQTCCGQMHVNTGYPREAIPLVRNHVAAFEGYEAIVVPSGSCTAAIRHQHADVARLAGDAALAGAAEAIAARTWELSEFLVDVLGVTDVGAYFPHRVTYHPTCHSLRLLRVGQRPLQLLRAVEGIDLKDLRSLADEGKKKVGSGVVAIVGVTEDGKAGIVVGVTNDLVSRFNAVDLVRKGAEALGGKGGGGRPDMAQAGGPDGSKADAALAAIEAALGG